MWSVDYFRKQPSGKIQKTTDHGVPHYIWYVYNTMPAIKFQRTFWRRKQEDSKGQIEEVSHDAVAFSDGRKATPKKSQKQWS